MPVFPSTKSAVIVRGADARCGLRDVAAGPRAEVNRLRRVGAHKRSAWSLRLRKHSYARTATCAELHGKLRLKNLFEQFALIHRRRRADP